MKMYKRITAGVVALICTLAFMPVLSGGTVHADALKVDKTSLTFDKDDSQEILPVDPDVSLFEDECFTHDQNVASYSVYSGYESYSDRVIVYPEGEGKTLVTITDINGNKVNIPITVTKECMDDKLRADSLLNYSYGDKRFEITTWPKATGTVRIGSKTYSFTANKAGNYVSKKLPVKRVGTKVCCTVKSGKYSAKWTSKIEAKTHMPGAKKAAAYKIRLYIYNPHKGDIIKLNYKGKNYSKKVKKDASFHTKQYVFKVKKKVSKHAKIKVTIRNKFKQRLDSGSYKLPYAEM